MSDNQPYNPLDKRNLAENVADKMLAQPMQSLPLIQRFSGAGIYAIYYMGDFSAYQPIAVANDNLDEPSAKPIYVGRAVPEGARKGLYGLISNPGPVLFNRLNKHASSIKQVKNLHLEDFRCRYLVVDDIWIPLAESLLINRFSPIWNTVVDGFGNHPPGGGRTGQRRSRWDTIHPGRGWAGNLPDNSIGEAEILQLVRQALAY